MAKKWSSEKFKTLRKKKFPDHGGGAEAARQVGMSRSNLQQYENGAKVPGVNTAAALAELVGVRVDDLLA